MKLLIDGYNLIPAIPELGRLLRQDLEAGREALLRLLADYRRLSPERPAVTVVFDGKNRIGVERGSRTAGIEVIFSRGETADDLILRLLREKKSGAVLVTSDRALRAAASPHAGAVVRSGEFAGRLLQVKMMAETGLGPEEREPPPRHRRVTTKKKGNPHRLPKRKRERSRRLRKL